MTQNETTSATAPHAYVEHPGKGCKVCGRTRGTKLHTEGSRQMIAARVAAIRAEREIETPTEAEQLALDGGVALTAADWAAAKEIMLAARAAGILSAEQLAAMDAMTVTPLKVG